MQKITIMIVDDHNLIREAYRFFLSLEPAFKVTEDAGDCYEAIEMTGRLKPDVILLNIDMPALSGFEMIEKLCELSPESKIIGLSAHTEIAYIKKMMRLGAKGYLTKDTTIKEMVAAILQVHEGKSFLCRSVKEILAEQAMDPATGAAEAGLTAREIQVLSHLRNALSSKEIAGELQISFRTVEVHRCRILKKLKMKNTMSAVNFYNTTYA